MSQIQSNEALSFDNPFELAAFLEANARRYDPEYGRAIIHPLKPEEITDIHVSDGFDVTRGTKDFMGNLLTSIKFEVERIREEAINGASPIVTTYEIEGKIKYRGLRFVQFSGAIQDMLFKVADDEEGKKLLQEETTSFDIEFTNKFEASTDGLFSYGPELNIIVDGDMPVPIPLYDTVSSLDDNDEEGAGQDIEPQDTDSFFELFSSDELLELAEASDVAIREDQLENVMVLFRNAIEANRYRSQQERMLQAARMVEQLFS